MQILFLEGYYGGSHQAFADGWQKRSRHNIHILSLPARKWKWRMQTGAWAFADQVAQNACAWEKRTVLDGGFPRPDIIVATDMINLAEFRGLTRNTLADTPALLYFHENQYSYPPQIAGKAEYFWGVINAASALAADALAFNSHFHREDFFKNWRKGNKIMPDRRIDEKRLSTMEKNAQIIPVGVDFDFFDKNKTTTETETDQPPLIIWNHRWEHDKQPEVFFDTLRHVRDKGRKFRLAVCGESFPSRPDCFDIAKKEFSEESIAFGYLNTKEEYARILWQSDILVSTSIQEFLGLSVIEALWCGCHPLLPQRLNYPHLLPADQHEKHIYKSDQDLSEKMLTLLKNKTPRLNYLSRQPYLDPYNWPTVAKQLDRLSEDMLK